MALQRCHPAKSNDNDIVGFIDTVELHAGRWLRTVQPSVVLRYRAIPMLPGRRVLLVRIPRETSIVQLADRFVVEHIGAAAVAALAQPPSLLPITAVPPPPPPTEEAAAAAELHSDAAVREGNDDGPKEEEEDDDAPPVAKRPKRRTPPAVVTVDDVLNAVRPPRGQQLGCLNAFVAEELVRLGERPAFTDPAALIAFWRETYDALYRCVEQCLPDTAIVPLPLDAKQSKLLEPLLRNNAEAVTLLYLRRVTNPLDLRAVAHLFAWRTTADHMRLLRAVEAATAPMDDAAATALLRQLCLTAKTILGDRKVQPKNGRVLKKGTKDPMLFFCLSWSVLWTYGVQSTRRVPQMDALRVLRTVTRMFAEREPSEDSWQHAVVLPGGAELDGSGVVLLYRLHRHGVPATHLSAVANVLEAAAERYGIPATPLPEVVFVEPPATLTGLADAFRSRSAAVADYIENLTWAWGQRPRESNGWMGAQRQYTKSTAGWVCIKEGLQPAWSRRCRPEMPMHRRGVTSTAG